MSQILEDKRANRGDTRRESIVRAARENLLGKGLLQDHRLRHRQQGRHDAIAVLPLLQRQGRRGRRRAG